MFGIGFTELLLISIVAILFLGPDKLPQALVDVAKFIKSVKQTIGDAKSSLEEEMKIADLKEEALNYKKQLDSATNELQNFKNLSLDDFDDDVSYDEEVSTKSSKELAKAPKVSNNTDTINTAEVQDDNTPTQIEQKQDETIVLKKKPKKSEKLTQNETKSDDTPKDNT